GVRMLAFTQACKVFGTNATLQPPLLGEPALPLTVTLLIAAPVVLFLRGKLPHMVSTSLSGLQRFRDREHTKFLKREVAFLAICLSFDSLRFLPGERLFGFGLGVTDGRTIDGRTKERKH